ncbi:DUF3891 family protein [Salinigranum salinum]|uniref:DUF3891 family protein n=1 Tax=Salinigranum salinum TaxID=1364937 RepID=UPI0012608011|nr:DUF3891 family protein [Salinigranum salinum]
MIVAETDSEYRFVSQPEHATQVGQFAHCWGNDTFADPTPKPPVAMAAALHDAGWADYDLAPHLVDGAPAGFLDTTPEEWTAFYDHGIEVVTARDRYAGLLCAMHGAGVRRGRYGTSDGHEVAEAFAAFVDAQEARQRALVDHLVADDHDAAHVTATDREVLEDLHAGRDPDAESGVFRNYRLLQVWDRLSLYCCDAAVHEETTIGAVPVAPGVPDVDLSVVPVDETTFALDPFPFDGSPVSTRVRTRTVSRDAFAPDDDAALVRAYHAVPVDTAQFRLVAH